MKPVLSILLLAAAPALGQEVMHTQAATMPSPGAFILREEFHVFQFGSNPESDAEQTTKFEADTLLAYGLARGWAAYLNVPVTHVSEENPDDSHTGIDELDAMLKWRFYQHDSGGIDTIRAAALGGVRMTFDDSVAAHPFLGVVVTAVQGRHGFNQDVIFRLNTEGSVRDNLGGDGPSDALFFNSAYLFRIAPARYTADTRGAWYITAELNGLYETNGDAELRWAPGLMYEGRKFAFEAMVQLPLWDEIDHRAEFDWGVGFGLRFFF